MKRNTCWLWAGIIQILPLSAHFHLFWLHWTKLKENKQRRRSKQRRRNKQNWDLDLLWWYFVSKSHQVLVLVSTSVNTPQVWKSKHCVCIGLMWFSGCGMYRLEVSTVFGSKSLFSLAINNEEMPIVHRIDGEGEQYSKLYMTLIVVRWNECSQSASHSKCVFLIIGLCAWYHSNEMYTFLCSRLLESVDRHIKS